MIWKWLFWWKKTFFHILKQFEAYWKIFKTGPKKNLRGDLRTKGGPLEKIFLKHVFMIWKWLFWWKKTFFHILKQFEAYWKFSKLPEKKFKGWPQDQRGDHWKKIFLKHVFMIWKWLFWWKKTFFHILKAFEAYWKFSKRTEKKFKGWPQDQRGDHWKKIFSKHVFMIWKWLFWWKKSFFHILKSIWSMYWKIFKTARKKI